MYGSAREELTTWSDREPRAGGLGVRALLLVLTVLAILSAALAMPQAVFAADLPALPAAMSRPAHVDFAGEAPSADARGVADWAIASGDSQGLPFMVVDKPQARMFMFRRDGTLLGAAPVLLGLATGDDSPPGIGDRPLSAITPAERITPAGRFVAELGRNLAGQDILWVDYAAAISVHRASDPKHGLTRGGRLARLASASIADNRISHGCINLSAADYDRLIRPAFAGTAGIVYVLPETRPVGEVFAMAARSATPA